MDSRWYGALSRSIPRREAALLLCWVAGMTSLYAQALFQKTYLSTLDQAMIFIFCMVVGALITDVGYALLGYIFAIATSTGLVLLISVLPVASGNFTLLGNEIMNQLWLGVIFKALFPFPFIMFLAASIIGSIIGERYFY